MEDFKINFLKNSFFLVLIFNYQVEFCFFIFRFLIFDARHMCIECIITISLIHLFLLVSVLLIRISGQGYGQFIEMQRY